MRTSHMRLQGLRNLKMDYLRMIRHMGLTDAKALLRVRTDLKLTGQYSLKGEVLLIPLSGKTTRVQKRLISNN